MSDVRAWRRSTTVVGALVAVLVAFEAVVLQSGLPDAVRYGLGGAGAAALLVGVAQLGANRRHSATDHRS